LAGIATIIVGVAVALMPATAKYRINATI
jgi:hypothetical protein